MYILYKQSLSKTSSLKVSCLCSDQGFSHSITNSFKKAFTEHQVCTYCEVKHRQTVEL